MVMAALSEQAARWRHEAPRAELPEGPIADTWASGELWQRYRTAEQRCWNHKILNVLAKLPKRQQIMLRTIPYGRLGQRLSGSGRCSPGGAATHSYEAASEALERDWDGFL